MPILRKLKKKYRQGKFIPKGRDKADPNNQYLCNDNYGFWGGKKCRRKAVSGSGRKAKKFWHFAQ